MPSETPTIRVRRAEVDSICIYEITDSELEELERGSPGSLQLNFALVLLPTSFSTLTTMLFTEIKSDRVFVVLTVIVVGTLIVGLIMLIMWYRSHKSSKKVSVRIRERLEVESSEPVIENDSLVVNL